MPDQQMIDGTTAPDRYNQLVAVGDTIAAAFSDLNGPEVRVGVVLGFHERTSVKFVHDGPRTLMEVSWVEFRSEKPTKIEVLHRRFVRIAPLPAAVMAS